MNVEKFIKHGYDMIYLAACALNSGIPQKEILAKMNFNCVYKMAAKHSMQAITFIALESFIAENEDNKNLIDSQLLSKWKVVKSKVVHRNVLFDDERRKIIDFMEENGIWYMCMKGIVMQEYYAKLGMRQMCDNDILFDPSKRKILHDFMLKNEYESTMYNTGYPDSYLKMNAFNFEMHHSLYTESDSEKAFCDYYQDVKNRLVKDQNNNFGYHFSKEDFYIYSTTHAYKHILCGGNGIRSLMDVFVYISKEKDTLDFAYIESELKKLGVAEFENTVRSLAFKLFEDCQYLEKDNDVLTDKEKEWLGFYLGSGTYGTTQNKIEMNVERHFTEDDSNVGKLKYVLRRIFPKMSFYKVLHPFLYKYRIFIPFYIIWRLISRGVFNLKTSMFELKTILKKKSK